jgi:HSP20 family protein
MGSLLGDVMGGVEGRKAGLLSGMVLPVDIEETEEAFVVELDLPGVRREDISVDLRDRELFVTGESRERERTGCCAAGAARWVGSSTASPCRVTLTRNR